MAVWVLKSMSVSTIIDAGNQTGKNIRASQQVPELESLGKIGVPDHGAVLDADLGVHLVDLRDLLDTLVQRLLRPEDGDIALHDLLHGQTNLGGVLGAVGGTDLVENLDRVSTSISRQRVELRAGLEVVADGVRDGTAEDDEIEEGVGTETVSTVDGHTGSLTAGEETGHNLVLALLVDGKNLTSVAGGDTTHVVVDSRKDGNGLLADIDTSEDTGSLGDTGKTLGENLSGEMAELEVDMVLLRADTTSLTDLHGHGSGDDVTGSKILGCRGVTLHEALTLAVEEVTTLTTSTLSDQAAGTVNTGGMELDELEILVGETGTSNHGHTITCAGVGRCAREVGASVTTGGEDSVLSEETVEGAVLLVVGDNTVALAVLHNQIHGEVLDEVVGVVGERLAVESVKHGVSGTIGSGTGAVGLATLSKFPGLTTESTLVARKQTKSALAFPFQTNPSRSILLTSCHPRFWKRGSRSSRAR